MTESKTVKHLQDAVKGCLAWEDKFIPSKPMELKRPRVRSINIFNSNDVENAYRINREKSAHPTSVRVFPNRRLVEAKSDVLNQRGEIRVASPRRPNLRWKWQRDEWKATCSQLHYNRVRSSSKNGSRPGTAKQVVGPKIIAAPPTPPVVKDVSRSVETGKGRPLSARLKRKISELCSVLP